MFWSYLTIAIFMQRASGQDHLCHLFIYGSPASPLIVSKSIYILAPQHLSILISCFVGRFIFAVSAQYFAF
jgi:hypothetical protein